jgi:prepilin peptidase CpaA
MFFSQRRNAMTLIDYTLWLVLTISLITDLKSRKILNIVTYPAIAFGLIYHTVSFGWDGFLFSSKGLLVGFILLLIPFLLGGMGAGDVKLLAAIGSLKGVIFVFHCFVYTAIIGGVISLVILAYKKRLGTLIRQFFLTYLLRGNAGSLNIKEKKEQLTFPYGVAIVLGAYLASYWGGF